MPNEFILLKNQQLQHLKFIRSFEPEVSAFSQFSYKKITHMLGGNLLFLFNLNHGNSKPMCEICSKLMIMTSERHHIPHSNSSHVSIVTWDR